MFFIVFYFRQDNVSSKPRNWTKTYFVAYLLWIKYARNWSSVTFPTCGGETTAPRVVVPSQAQMFKETNLKQQFPYKMVNKIDPHFINSLRITVVGGISVTGTQDKS